MLSNCFLNEAVHLVMVTFPSHPFCPILTFSLFVSSHLPLLPPPHLPTFLPQACPLFLFPMSISCFACYFLQLLAPAIDLYQLNWSHISPESFLLLVRILTLIHLIWVKESRMTWTDQHNNSHPRSTSPFHSTGQSSKASWIEIIVTSEQSHNQ